MDTLQLEVTGILPETEDTATIFFKRADGNPLPYQAGQFLTFIFTRQDRELRRSYSFSSTPGIDPTPSITVKKIPNGEISRQLIQHLSPGDLLTALPPAGRFTISTNESERRQFIFITAGSGIVPVFSLLKKLLLGETGSTVLLLDQNHNEDQVIFKDRLSRMAADYPNLFRWINLLSKPGSRYIQPERLTNEALEQMIPERLIAGKEPAFYLCGPPAFMRMAQFTLKAMGYADHQIKKEHFTVESFPPLPPIPNPVPRSLTLHYGKKTVLLETIYPQTILEAALARNIQIPYSCRSGRCTSCVAKCLRGVVRMRVNEALTEKEVAEGLVLTCVGYPETDAEIRV